MRPNRILRLPAALLGLTVLPAAEDATLVLANDLLRVEIDRRHGALLDISPRRAEWVAGPRRPEGRSFRLHVPRPEQRSHLIRGEDQAPPRIEAAAAGDAARLVWPELTGADGGVLPIRLTAVLTLTGAALRVETEIANASPYTVESVAYPALADLGARFPDGAIHRQHLGYAQLATLPIRPTFGTERGYWGVDHPLQVTAAHDSPFQLVTNHRQGFYLGFHARAPEFLAEFACELTPGWRSELRQDVPGERIGELPVRLELRATQFPFLAPGRTARLSPVVVAPYLGGWFRGLETYKSWRAAWLRRRPPPAWVEDVHAWQQIRMNSAEDRVLYRYRDLPVLAAECARHGIRALQVTGWNLGGQDRNNPSHDPDPRLGTADELRAAIAAAQRLGVRIVLFSKFTWADRATPWYRETLHRHAIRDPHGDPYVSQGYRYDTPTQLADINTRRFTPLCPLDAGWRAVVTAETAKMVATGADGTLFDESQHHGAGNLCFAPDHGHDVPSFTHTGNAALAGALRAAAAPERDFLLAGEALQDGQWQDYALSYFRLRPATDLPQRYLDPHAPILVAVTGFDDREMINEALRLRLILSYEPYNFKGRLADFPLTLAYGRLMDEFRRRHRDFLWEGEYRATEGATVDPGDAEATPFAVYRRSDGRRALVIVNHRSAAALRPRVRLDGASGTWLVASPENPVPAPLAGELSIPARSVAVLFEP